MKELDHNPVAASAKGRCPRCASGRLFDGFLAPARECEACGLDFRFIDSGDGPAVLVIMAVGFLTVGLALWAEVAHDMALWLHFVLWPALAVALSLPLLRVLKGAMIGQQFARSAAEGRVSMRGESAGETASETASEAAAGAVGAADPAPGTDADPDADPGTGARPRGPPPGGGRPRDERPRDETDPVA